MHALPDQRGRRTLPVAVAEAEAEAEAEAKSGVVANSEEIK